MPRHSRRTLAAPGALIIGACVSAAALMQSFSAHESQCEAAKAAAKSIPQSSMDVLQQLYPACQQSALSLNDFFNAALGGIVIGSAAYLFFLAYGKVARWLAD